LRSRFEKLLGVSSQGFKISKHCSASSAFETETRTSRVRRLRTLAFPQTNTAARFAFPVRTKPWDQRQEEFSCQARARRARRFYRAPRCGETGGEAGVRRREDFSAGKKKTEKKTTASVRGVRGLRVDVRELNALQGVAVLHHRELQRTHDGPIALIPRGDPQGFGGDVRAVLRVRALPRPRVVVLKYAARKRAWPRRRH
jgi:hypothetical protein